MLDCSLTSPSTYIADTAQGEQQHLNNATERWLTFGLAALKCDNMIKYTLTHACTHCAPAQSRYGYVDPISGVSQQVATRQ